MTAEEIIMATIEEMDDSQRNRILKTDKAYVVVKCSIFNAGAIVNVLCTNKYRNVHVGSGYNYIIETAYMVRYVRRYNRYNSYNKNNS